MRKKKALFNQNKQSRSGTFFHFLLFVSPVLFTLVFTSACEKDKCEEPAIVYFNKARKIPYKNDSVVTYMYRRLEWGLPDTMVWGLPDTQKMKLYQAEPIFIRELDDNKYCPLYREAWFFDFGGNHYQFVKVYVIPGNTPGENGQLSLSVADKNARWELGPTDYPKMTADSSYIFELPDGATMHYKNDSGLVKLVSEHAIIKRIK